VDINLLRGLVTLALFVLFVALCLWAWSDRRRADFDAAAHLPFAEDEQTPGAPGRENR
jgi:cytochrome c oxidase cbb3-type subunit 4